MRRRRRRGEGEVGGGGEGEEGRRNKRRKSLTKFTDYRRKILLNNTFKVKTI